MNLELTKAIISEYLFFEFGLEYSDSQEFNNIQSQFEAEKPDFALLLNSRVEKQNSLGYFINLDEFKKNEIDYVKGLISEFKKYCNDPKNIKNPNYHFLVKWVEYLNELQNLPPQPTTYKTVSKKYRAKDHVMAYLFDCNVKGESILFGNKIGLEAIGNKRIGEGKGNRFYKAFNEVINSNIDLNNENELISSFGENWRTILIELSENPRELEKYLQSKQL